MNWERFFSTTDVKVLFYLDEYREARHASLLRLIGGRGMLSRALQDLRRRKLIDRIVEQTTPIQTKYKLTDDGVRAVRLLNELEKVVSK